VKLSQENLKKDIMKKQLILDSIEKCLKLEYKTFEEYVMHLYIKHQKGAEIAKLLDELGYKVKTNSYVGRKKFNANDITNIIQKNYNKRNDDIRSRNYIFSSVSHMLYKYNFGDYKIGTIYNEMKRLEPFLFNYKLDINAEYLTDGTEFKALYVEKK